MKCFYDNIEVSFPAVAGGIYVYAKMSASFERILQDFAAGSSKLGVDSQVVGRSTKLFHMVP